MSTASAVRAKCRDCGVRSQGSLPPGAVPQDCGDCAPFLHLGVGAWRASVAVLRHVFALTVVLAARAPRAPGAAGPEGQGERLTSWGEGRPQQE